MKPFLVEDGKKEKRIIEIIKESRTEAENCSNIIIMRGNMDSKQIESILDRFNAAVGNYQNNTKYLADFYIAHL